jgi:hypothetical protein
MLYHVGIDFEKYSDVLGFPSRRRPPLLTAKTMAARRKHLTPRQNGATAGAADNHPPGEIERRKACILNDMGVKDAVLFSIENNPPRTEASQCSNCT